MIPVRSLLLLAAVLLLPVSPLLSDCYHYYDDYDYDDDCDYAYDYVYAYVYGYGASYYHY